MRKALVIALGLTTLAALAGTPQAFAVQKQVCNTTWFAGQTTRQMARCKTIGGCTTTYPIGGLAANTKCFWVEIQPGAPSDTGGTNPNTHYKAN
jgi:hypothetical protein